MHDQTSDLPIERTENPFQKKATALQKRDRIVSVVLRVATYFILACAAFIFLDIIRKGAPVVFQA
ncbi:MAG: hypothetical protein AAGC68_17050, partial [Verrucomicrobiota bacterium]